MSQTDIRSLIAEMRARCEAATPNQKLRVVQDHLTVLRFHAITPAMMFALADIVPDVDWLMTELRQCWRDRTDLLRALEILMAGITAIRDDANDDGDVETWAVCNVALREAEAALRGEAK